MKSSASSSPARSWASSSSLLALALLLAACDAASPGIPGETAEYFAWKGGIGATSGFLGGITGGVEKKKLTIDFQGFPVSETNDQWIELAINSQIVQRFSLYSPSKRPLNLRYEAQIPQGMLQVKVWYTGTNQGYSNTTETPHGTQFIVRKTGNNVVIQQIAQPK